MAVAAAYNLTDDVALCVHLLSKRVAGLEHLRPAQIVHGITQARNRSRFGVFAECHGLRFKNGAREMTSGRHAWVWPEIRLRGHEILYYITYYLPRFLDLSPAERLNTLIHELWHIAPAFNGDLRRFPGRNEFHGASFDRDVGTLCEKARTEIDVERFPFLRWSYDELVQRYGAVAGARLKNFRPRRVRPAELPSNLAVTPPGATLPGRQRLIW